MLAVYAFIITVIAAVIVAGGAAYYSLHNSLVADGMRGERKAADVALLGSQMAKLLAKFGIPAPEGQPHAQGLGQAPAE